MSSIYKLIGFTQPTSFEFTKQNMKKVEEILKKYPNQNKRSAVMPLLHLAQEQNNNWVPKAAMDYIAKLLDLTPMQVYEVANFYTMYNKQPVGDNLIQVCRTTPCWLSGSNKITEICKKKLGIDIGETTNDKQFTLVEVECLGACVNAPVVQINNDYYEDLSPEKMDAVLESITNNRKIAHGSQSGRLNSAPEGWIAKPKN
ncbi:MAG: NADH-quinone oxidoreductase subunit NuoE [Candidatus Midichloria sp.]|nr:NADH-quinone oxidoreductase subunit NuoE [Candidatus Midichloria sp.]